ALPIFMKAFAEEGKDGMTLNCTARRSDDNELSVTMSVSAATYDSEVCTQIVLQPEHSDAELEEKLKQISSQDLLTGLYNRQYLMDALAQTIANAGKHNESGALAYIALDNFLSMKSQVGISGADLLLGDLATLLKENTGEEMTLARLSDDAFCLMCLPCDDKTMEKLCEKVRKAVEDHLFDINGRTVPLTVSIGVAAITENSPKAEELLGRAHTASAEVKKQPGHEAGNGIVVYNPATYDSVYEFHSVEEILVSRYDDHFVLLFLLPINLRGSVDELVAAFVRLLHEDHEELPLEDFLASMGPHHTALKIPRR